MALHQPMADRGWAAWADDWEWRMHLDVTVVPGGPDFDYVFRQACGGSCAAGDCVCDVELHDRVRVTKRSHDGAATRITFVRASVAAERARGLKELHLPAPPPPSHG